MLSSGIKSGAKRKPLTVNSPARIARGQDQVVIKDSQTQRSG